MKRILQFLGVLLLLAGVIIASLMFGGGDSPAMLPELRAFDKTYDNGPAIRAWALAAKELPPGNYYVLTTIKTGAGAAGEIDGVGAPDQCRGDEAWRDQPVTNIIWAGAAGGELLEINRATFTVRDVGLQGAPLKEANSPAGSGTLVAVRQTWRTLPDGTRQATWPVGLIKFENVTLLAAERGIYFAPGNHDDHPRAQLVSHRVQEPYVVDENQSVQHVVDLTTKGHGRYVFNCLDGGRFVGVATIEGKWDAVLSLGKEYWQVDEAGDNRVVKTTGPTKNNGDFRVFCWMDNSSRDVCFVKEQTNRHPAIVRFDGYRSSQVTLAEPAIVKRSPLSKFYIDVESHVARYVFP